MTQPKGGQLEIESSAICLSSPLFTVATMQTMWQGISICFAGSCGKGDNTRAPRYDWQTHLPQAKHPSWSRTIPAASFHNPRTRHSQLSQAKPSSRRFYKPESLNTAAMKDLKRQLTSSLNSRIPGDTATLPSLCKAPAVLHSESMLTEKKLPNRHSKTDKSYRTQRPNWQAVLKHTAKANNHNKCLTDTMEDHSQE